MATHGYIRSEYVYDIGIVINTAVAVLRYDEAIKQITKLIEASE